MKFFYGGFGVESFSYFGKISTDGFSTYYYKTTTLIFLPAK